MVRRADDSCTARAVFDPAETAVGETVGLSRSQTNLSLVKGPSTIDDPLAAFPEGAYAWNVCVKAFIRRHRALLLLSAIVVAVAALGAGIFTSAYLRVLHAGFEDRSLAYAQAFAASAIPWLDREETDTLRSAALLFLAGSTRYIQIWDGQQLQVDERASALTDMELELVAPPATGTVARISTMADEWILDVRVPIEIEGEAGYIRVGIDRSAVLGQARTAIAAASGGAFGFAALLLGILALALQRGPRRGAKMDSGEHSVMQAGPLIVNPVRKTITLDGIHVRVTPKQYLLLELLVSEPGRVFTEREILDAAWPDSPYADAKDIKQYVYLVRRRLAEVRPDAKGMIETVPGFGYRMNSKAVDRDLTP